MFKEHDEHYYAALNASHRRDDGFTEDKSPSGDNGDPRGPDPSPPEPEAQIPAAQEQEAQHNPGGYRAEMLRSLTQLAVAVEKQARLTAEAADIANTLTQELIETTSRAGGQSFQQLNISACKNAYYAAEVAIQAKLSAMQAHTALLNQVLSELEAAKDAPHCYSQEFSEPGKSLPLSQPEDDQDDRARPEHSAKQSAALNTSDELAFAKHVHEMRMAAIGQTKKRLDQSQQLAENAHNEYLQLRQQSDELRKQWENLQKIQLWVPSAPPASMPYTPPDISPPDAAPPVPPVSIPYMPPDAAPPVPPVSIPYMPPDVAPPVSIPYVPPDAAPPVSIPYVPPDAAPPVSIPYVPPDVSSPAPPVIAKPAISSVGQYTMPSDDSATPILAGTVPQPTPAVNAGALTAAQREKTVILPNSADADTKVLAATTTTEPPAPGEKKAISRRLWLYAKVLVVSLAIVICLRAFFFDVVVVEGVSMLPTLQPYDSLLSSKIAYKINEPQRYDIILLDAPDETGYFIKRVIALPNEHLQITNGQVFINGLLLQEEYLSNVQTDGDINTVIPDGYYFVMGDNRPASRDSRSDSVGLIAKEHINGKAVIRLFPPKSIKLL